MSLVEELLLALKAQLRAQEVRSRPVVQMELLRSVHRRAKEMTDAAIARAEREGVK